jgi:hypothetical protein
MRYLDITNELIRSNIFYVIGTTLIGESWF